MDTHRLRAFVAVAEELHFGRAAERLHMSQPPLSMLIRTLEDELGVKLFRRNSRRVELAEPGRVLLAEAREILDRIAGARRRTIEAGSGARGTLTIGFITPIIYSILPGLLREFRSRYPDVQVTLREAMSDVQFRELEAGTLSAGFVAAPVPGDRLAHRTVLVERMVAALPARHALARARSPLSLGRIADESFVLFPRVSAPGLFDEIVGFCRTAGFSPRIEQEAVHSQTIVALVSAGFGVAIVPESIRHLKRPGVVYRGFRERAPRVRTSMAWKADNDAPALQSFLGIVERYIS